MAACNINVRAASSDLGSHDVPVVPRGVEHRRPSAVTPDALVLTFEPSTTLNTGMVTTAWTVAQPERL